MAKPIHIDIGGEGRYPDAINLNPSSTTTTGIGVPAGSPIPNHVAGIGEQMPFTDHYADIITVENTPLRPAASQEIARVIKPGGKIRLYHPTSAKPGGSVAHLDVVRVVGGRSYSVEAGGFTTTLILAPP